MFLNIVHYDFASRSEVFPSISLHVVDYLDASLWKDGAWNTICLPFRLNGIEGTPLAGATVNSQVLYYEVSAE